MQKVTRMASDNSTPPQPSKAEIEGILQLGLAIQGISGWPTQDLTMLEVVNLWKTTFNESMLNAALGPLLPPGTNATETIHSVSAVLSMLPPSTNHPKRSIAVYIFMTILTTFVVALRFYTRKYVSPKKIMLEDWTCLIALLVIYLATGTLWAELLNSYGGGRHLWDNVTYRQLCKLMHLFFANEYTFVLSHLWVKYAFLAFYHRFSPDRMFRRIIIGVTVYFTLLIMAGILVVTLQCKPLDFWNHLITAKCIDRRAAFTAHGSFVIFADVLLLVLPISQVLKLKLKLRDKILLVIMFGTGALICIASIIRVDYLYRWLSSVDVTGGFEDHSLWYLLELDASMIVCCGPAIKVFFTHQKPKFQRTVPGESKMSFTPSGFFKGSLWRERNNNKKQESAELPSVKTMDTAATSLFKENSRDGKSKVVNEKKALATEVKSTESDNV